MRYPADVHCISFRNSFFSAKLRKSVYTPGNLRANNEGHREGLPREPTESKYHHDSHQHLYDLKRLWTDVDRQFVRRGTTRVTLHNTRSRYHIWKIYQFVHLPNLTVWGNPAKKLSPLFTDHKSKDDTADDGRKLCRPQIDLANLQAKTLTC